MSEVKGNHSEVESESSLDKDVEVQRARHLLAQGKLDLMCDNRTTLPVRVNVEQSVNQLQQAAVVLVTKFGPAAAECGDVYLWLGCALLKLACLTGQKHQNECLEPLSKPFTEPLSEPLTEPLSEPLTEPLGEPLTEPPSEPLTEPPSEPLTEPLFGARDEDSLEKGITAPPSDKTTAPSSECDKATAPPSDKATAPPREKEKSVRRLQRVALRSLQWAKVIFDKDKTTEGKLKLVQTLLKLGQVSTEIGSYGQALKDLDLCLETLKCLLDPDSQRLVVVQRLQTALQGYSVLSRQALRKQLVDLNDFIDDMSRQVDVMVDVIRSDLTPASPVRHQIEVAPPLSMGPVVEFDLDQYRIMWKIGRGSHGQIYIAVNIATGQKAAVKLAPSRDSHLKNEIEVLRVLSGRDALPTVRWSGRCKRLFCDSLVLDLLGPSLKVLFKFCGRQLALKTVLSLAHQMIAIIEYVHVQNFIHRSIKPENFVMGIGSNCHKVYLIDFGRARRYRDEKTEEHIPYREGEDFNGDLRYATINAHLGVELSRRDDLEALGYVLMFLLRGSLPWQGLNSDDERFRVKTTTSCEALCEGFPPEFCTYSTYCRGLGFDQTPDYQYLKQLFRTLSTRLNIQDDRVFDWT